jgi:hypothetical protein
MCNGTNSKGVLSVKKQYGVTPERVKRKYEPAVKSTDPRALFATSGRLSANYRGGRDAFTGRLESRRKAAIPNDGLRGRARGQTPPNFTVS